MIFVSIIVPVYNSQKVIENCIESIIKQTYKNFELIIINDGSTDNSHEIICKYEKKYKNIKYISSSNNGVSHARNIGLEVAIGDYVTFVDSDDLVDEDYLMNFIKIVENNKYDLIFSPFKVLNKKLIIKKVNLDSCIIDYKMKKDFMISLFTFESNFFDTTYFNGYVFGKFYSKDIYNNIRFEEDISIREDALFVFQAFLNSKICFFNNSYGYTYVLSNNSTMAKYKQNYIVELKKYAYLVQKSLNSLDSGTDKYNLSVLRMYMLWLKMDVLNSKSEYEKNDIKSLINESFSDDFWYMSFSGINKKQLKLPYRLLRKFYLEKNIFMIKLLYKLNSFVRR